MPGFRGQTSLLFELATRTLVEGLTLLEPALDVVFTSTRHTTHPRKRPGPSSVGALAPADEERLVAYHNSA